MPSRAASLPPPLLESPVTLAAVVVVFGQARLQPGTLESLCDAAGAVLVVDNNPAPDAHLAAQLARQRKITLLHNANRGGLAGAYNLALDTLQRNAADIGITHVTFVDQDSNVGSLRQFTADPAVDALLRRPDVAAASPAYRDRTTGLRGRYIELGRWRLVHLPRQFDGLRLVAFVINSMTVWRLQALQHIGPFNEDLAIDHVDTEYCLRARQQRLGIWVHGNHEFLHAIGQRRRYRLLGRELQAGGHSPPRRHMIGRNTMLLARRWCLREPAFAGLCLMRLVYEAAGILMAEDDKPAKLRALIGGAFEGLLGLRRS